MNNYYPFGLRFNQAPLVNKQDNNYLYNGKELQQFGLDWYDYGARMYDAALGRFHATDPIAGVAPNWTPYRYAFNNPLKYIDPNGMSERAADRFWNNHIEEFNSWGEEDDDEDENEKKDKEQKQNKTQNSGDACSGGIIIGLKLDLNTQVKQLMLQGLRIEVGVYWKQNISDKQNLIIA